MSDYEVFAFDPHDIASLRPRSHQTRILTARERAIGMLERVEAGDIPVCGNCGHVHKSRLPPALVVVVPKDPSGRSVGTWVCKRCLKGDPLETLTDTFSKVLPDGRFEIVQ